MKLSNDKYREYAKKLDFYGIVRISVNRSNVLIIQYSILNDSYICGVTGCNNGYTSTGNQHILQGAKTATQAVKMALNTIK